MPRLLRPTFSITARLHPCPGTWPNLTHRVNEFSEQISGDGNRSSTTAKVHRNCQLACIIGLEELFEAEQDHFERIDVTVWVEEKIVASLKLTPERLALYNNKVVVTPPLQLGIRDGVLAIWVSIYWKPDLIQTRGRVTQNFFDIHYITEYGMALTPLQGGDPVAMPPRSRNIDMKASNKIKKEPKTQSSSSPTPRIFKQARTTSVKKEKESRPLAVKSEITERTPHQSLKRDDDIQDNKTARLKNLVGSLKALNDSIPPQSDMTPSPRTLNESFEGNDFPIHHVDHSRDDQLNQGALSSDRDNVEEGQIVESIKNENKGEGEGMEMSQLIKETTELKVKRKYEEARASLYAEKRLLYTARRKAIEEKLLLDQEKLRWERSEQRAVRESSLCRRIS